MSLQLFFHGAVHVDPKLIFHEGWFIVGNEDSGPDNICVSDNFSLGVQEESVECDFVDGHILDGYGFELTHIIGDDALQPSIHIA